MNTFNVEKIDISFLKDYDVKSKCLSWFTYKDIFDLRQITLETWEVAVECVRTDPNLPNRNILGTIKSKEEFIKVVEMFEMLKGGQKKKHS